MISDNVQEVRSDLTAMKLSVLVHLIFIRRKKLCDFSLSHLDDKSRRFWLQIVLSFW